MGSDKEAAKCLKEVAAMAAKIKNQDIAKDAALFFDLMNARCNPSYVTILPGVILVNIFKRLNMQDVMSCLQTCHSFRGNLLETLQ